ncbi:DnaJ C-terminal domain-containing protein [Myceligenerans crystallogenes]|uniref:DnaJ C-terminal domain-containing protein n=1 Tax=Myceligenerans crystallogenes TaxID=316335 RepID=A0ABP4ZXN9_9MICO
MTGQDWMEKDFYAVLGVPKDADDATIKKAYRKLARTHHPDQNQGDEAAEARFKAIGEAYAVLSDAEQRRQYDAIRAMAGGARFSAGPGGGSANGFEDILGAMFGGGGAGAAGGPRVRYSQGRPGGPGAAGFEDILGGMFGGAAGGPAGFRAAERGADVSAATTLPFRTALEGATVELTVDGRKLTARIPAGVNDGQKVRLRGKGRPGPGGGQPGDLLVTVRVAEHPVFRLDGANVRLTLPVTFPEATLGATVEVPTPSGETVKLKLPAGTASGKVLRAKGRGVQTPRSTGDLLVTVQVVVPQNLGKKARAALDEFVAASDGTDPRADLTERAKE